MSLRKPKENKKPNNAEIEKLIREQGAKPFNVNDLPDTLEINEAELENFLNWRREIREAEKESSKNWQLS